MPDTRTHRGPHPADKRLFAAEAAPVLRQAVSDYSWLLSRGYATDAALKLVGDRYQLALRQRLAVMRSSCSDEALARRRSRSVPADELHGADLNIDGFNVLTTVEAALSGGVLLRGRDGCLRDLASMHGSYRKVDETRPALELIGATLACFHPGEVRWFLDRPVSNSGRLATIIRDLALERGWNWQVELVPDADRAVAEGSPVTISADSVVLDRCRSWFNFAREVIAQIADAWIVTLAATTVAPGTESPRGGVLREDLHHG